VCKAVIKIIAIQFICHMLYMRPVASFFFRETASVYSAC